MYFEKATDLRVYLIVENFIACTVYIWCPPKGSSTEGLGGGASLEEVGSRGQYPC
jgi:hypothetical protein